MNSKTKVPWTGVLVTVIGALHTALGVAQWVAGDQAKELSFWFTGFGVVAVAYGLTLSDIERARGRLPGTHLVSLIAITAFGLAVYPVSGFATLLAPIATGVAGWRRR